MAKKKRKIDGRKKDLIILIVICAIAAVLLVLLLASLYRKIVEIFSGGWLSAAMFTLAIAVLALIVWMLNRRTKE